MSEFAKRLKACRVQRSMSQTEFAERTGFQPSAISHFENGGRMPSAENLIRIADALGVSTDWLLGRMLADHPMYGVARRIMQALNKMPDSDRMAMCEMAEILADKKNRIMVGCGK